MKCIDCGYYYPNVDKDGEPISFQNCHYIWDDGYAPCEVDETNYTEEE